MPNPDTSTGAYAWRTALISISVVMCVLLPITFIISLVCGYFIHQPWKRPSKKSKNESLPDSNRASEDGVVDATIQLENNVAYTSVHLLPDKSTK